MNGDGWRGQKNIKIMPYTHTAVREKERISNKHKKKGKESERQ